MSIVVVIDSSPGVWYHRPMRPIHPNETPAIEHEPGLFSKKLIDGSRGAHRIALLRGWLEPGGSHAPHTHDVEEAVMFLSGRCVLTVGGERHDIGPGDAVCIPAGIVHDTHNPYGERVEFVAAFPDSVIRSRPAAATVRAPRPRPILNRLRWLLRRALN
jgi:quercetin dioxygenase-like cupin family protein